MSEREERGWSGAEVAVVGLSGRFPGAAGLEQFWSNLRGGVESVTFFSDAEVLAAGVPPELAANPAYVKATACLDGVEQFDAGFFGYAPREAEALDPAHRLFLECAWEALETAGIDPARAGGAVGVYAGVGESHYFNHALRDHPELLATLGEAGASLASSKDFFATRVAYKLDLRGPAMSVQTGCSAGLVSVHLAVQALLGRECDVALAGGATVQVPQQAGYLYATGGIMSPDGHCRSYDARSAGTQVGSGVAVVCLKRLEDALRDGDPVRAVIRGSAVNNDGAAKVAFSAPSVEGQAAVIGEALAVAGVRADSIRYVEGHGSGTDLGDPIEVEALTEAFRAHTDARGFCALGSVKPNVGHLDAAAGTAGLVKTVLALEHREIPPTANFSTPNPAIDFARSPFYVSARAEPWERDGAPRRAGVSSFGIGGTNAHVVVEEAPELEASAPRRDRHLLLLSARTPAALDAATARLADHLRANPAQPLADVAWTLQAGRHQFAHRRALVVRDGEDAAALLDARHPDRVPTAAVPAGHRSPAFMFPGVGDQYPQMARGLYDGEPVFRAEVDRCAELLRPHLGLDLREVLFPGDAPAEAAPAFDLRRMLAAPAPSPDAERLNRTELAQPAVFVVEYALARLWMSLGVAPEAVIGHSLGEYAAACVAGVFALEDALELVAARARMVAALPAGAMLAVPLSAEEAAPFLADGVSVATVNAPGMCAVAGSPEAVQAFRARVEAAGHVARPLAAGHAFHSPAMDPLVAPVEALVARMRLRPPAIPMLSNVTGTWLTADEATDPRYWARHLRAPVRFSDGVAELLREPGRVLVEVGPGQTLSTFVRRHGGSADGASPAPAVVPTVRYPYDGTPDTAFLLGALARLWLAGIAPDWHAFHDGERLRSAVLPTYPWEKQRYWIDPPRSGTRTFSASANARRADPAAWLYIPAWRRAGPPAPAADVERARWLVFHDGSRLADAVAAELRARVGSVSVVRAGDHFASSEDGFTVRPADRADHDALADAARTADAPLHAVHLWASGPGEAARRQDAGFTSVSLLASSLARGGAARLLAVTSAAQDVAGGEDVDAVKATVAAACAVAAVEHPGLHARSLDVAFPSADADADVAALARRIVDEALADSGDVAIALRGGRRWVRAFEEARPSPAGPTLRRGGGYLLVGGLEGRNEALADHLLDRWDARVALLDQRLPHRGAWDQAIAARTADDPVRRTIEWVRAREAAGAEIVSLQAVLTEAGQVRDAVAQAETGMGRLDGVVAAWDLGELLEIEAAADLLPSRWTNRLERLEGRLRALESAVDGRALDFVALESSLTPLLGGVGRARLAGAQALVDAFAGRHGGATTPWTSVAWDRGFPPGAAVEGFGLAAGETGPAFEHALSLGEPRVAVSTGELNARVAAAAAPPPASTLGSYARPEIATDYFPPTGESESRIAALWQELLGIDRVGAHDDFFALGGHSLLATQVVSRMSAMFGLELPLKTVFEAPTVARYARLVEDAIMAEIDDMSAGEILSLA